MKRRATSRRFGSGEAIDLSDIPEVSPDAFAKGLVRKGLKSIGRKAQVTLRIDADVIEWFRGRGRGYQTRINSILKAYKEAHRGA
ncbi:MAG: BrnA antitoxin family protein [Candidatus Binatia bacterium]